MFRFRTLAWWLVLWRKIVLAPDDFLFWISDFSTDSCFEFSKWFVIGTIDFWPTAWASVWTIGMAWTVVWACNGIIVTFHCTFIVTLWQIGVTAVTDTFVVGVVAIVVTFFDFSGPVLSAFGWDRLSGWAEIGEIFENWTWTTVWTLFVTWTFTNAFGIFVETKIAAISVVWVAFDDTLLNKLWLRV